MRLLGSERNACSVLLMAHVLGESGRYFAKLRVCSNKAILVGYFVNCTDLFY